MTSMAPSVIQDWTGHFPPLAGTLLVKRDDLLPFALAGNKYRKLTAELQGVPTSTAILTVGAATSNHCRTVAMMAAQSGRPAHLVLHASNGIGGAEALALRMIEDLGASYQIVDPSEISRLVEDLREDAFAGAHFVAGGCHTARGVEAYIDAAVEIGTQLSRPPDRIVLASGTGATQAGLALGCQRQGWPTVVTGVSVARSAARGSAAVDEAMRWFTERPPRTPFLAAYTAGGYGARDERTESAVATAWSVGLPVDPVYTGKAFAALLNEPTLCPPGSLTVFWHTGGLFSYLAHSGS